MGLWEDGVHICVKSLLVLKLIARYTHVYHGKCTFIVYAILGANLLLRGFDYSM